jgi:predicted ATP-dependent endonuclease of OLD family
MFGFVEQGKDEIFKMEQRSKGFQWFLSFYIQSNLSDDKKGQHYLLVDEPGLYLHAKAQRDVLSVLEKRSNEVPVIFSTHSPYLIEPDKLNRVQLVFKDKKNGTIVESKLHKISDKETLTPILTAIGLELTSGILNTEKFLNVIVEGPSDFYYYNAFKKIFGNKNLNFIYGGGSGNMPKIGTILHGWGCQVIYLFDNDQGKKDGEKNLTTNWLVDKSQIEVITKKPSSNDIRIEDLFTLEDFVKYVLLEDEAKKYTINNSEYVKKNKFDKVLLAKNFLSSIEDIKVNISKTTKDNFKKVFNLLEPIFKNEPKNNTLI